MESAKQMEKTENSMKFLCPSCRETFEFDSIGEYQLVPCPICGIQYITVRKNQKIQLQTFEFNIENAEQEKKSNAD
jgi:Zn finger protein HypA/HybF involved in hydrogenase expression